jgi:hypothetical protein
VFLLQLLNSQSSPSPLSFRPAIPRSLPTGLSTNKSIKAGLPLKRRFVLKCPRYDGRGIYEPHLLGKARKIIMMQYQLRIHFLPLLRPAPASSDYYFPAPQLATAAVSSLLSMQRHSPGSSNCACPLRFSLAVAVSPLSNSASSAKTHRGIRLMRRPTGPSHSPSRGEAAKACHALYANNGRYGAVLFE